MTQSGFSTRLFLAVSPEVVVKWKTAVAGKFTGDVGTLIPEIEM